MKLVLIIQNKSPIRDYMELVLGANPNVNMILHSNASDSMVFLDLSPDVDLIFIGHDIFLDVELKAFNDSIKQYAKNNNKVSIIGSNKGLQKLDASKYLHPQSPIDKILNILKDTLSLEKSTFASEDFHPVPLSLCLGIYQNPCDIHIKIGKNDNAKYIKRFKSKDLFDKDAVLSLIVKDLAKVYVHKDDVGTLNSYFKNKIKKEDFCSSPIGENDIVKVYSNTIKDSLDYVGYMLTNMNLKSSGSVLVARIFENMRDEVLLLPSNNKKLINQFFINSLESENDFATKLVTLTSIMSTNMVQEATWGNSEMINKVIYASCFHDLALKGNQKLISCLRDEELVCLSEDESRQVNNHAQLVVSQLKELNVLPIGTDKMILEHHGSRNGVGLPSDQVTTTKISTLFMVASEFSTKLLLKYENDITGLDLQNFVNDELERIKKIDNEIFELLKASLL